jgi:hypothetical protein
MNELVINLLQFIFIHPAKRKAVDKHSDLSLIYGMEVVVRIYCSQIQKDMAIIDIHKFTNLKVTHAYQSVKTITIRIYTHLPKLK